MTFLSMQQLTYEEFTPAHAWKRHAPVGRTTPNENG